MAQTANKFAGLSDQFQELAKRADSLGLSLTHFNSGSSRNPNNGTRVFLADDAWHDHFRGDYLGHFRTKDEIEAFLTGYEAGSKKLA